MSYLGPLPRRRVRLFNTMTAGARQAFLAGHGGVRMEGAAAGGQPAATLQKDRVWYRITNNAQGPAVVDIFDEIGYWGTNAADFQRELAAITATEITVNLNSPGGEIFEGIAIHNALRSHPAAVTVRVAGLAASIASVIALAGDRVVMQPHSQMMIHDGSGFCIGDARDMREMADLLDKQSNNIAAVYAERAGGTVEEWRERMLAETWYSADEAVEAGLADEVDQPARQGQEPAAAAQPAAKWDLTVFKHAGREQAPAPQPVATAAPATGETGTDGTAPQGLRVVLGDQDITDDVKGPLPQPVVDALAAASGVHAYVRSEHSNAGNCECGMAEHSPSHPHEYAEALIPPGCVCSKSEDHPLHTREPADAMTAASQLAAPLEPEPAPTPWAGLTAPLLATPSWDDVTARLREASK